VRAQSQNTYFTSNNEKVNQSLGEIESIRVVTIAGRSVNRQIHNSQKKPTETTVQKQYKKKQNFSEYSVFSIKETQHNQTLHDL
jgi:hypothetical protein